MKISLHKKDWCHVCGSRENYCVDLWYSKNAENEKKDESQYARICLNCIRTSYAIIENGVSVE